jgi:putative salt-induced outer membrane protein YdiY
MKNTNMIRYNLLFIAFSLVAIAGVAQEPVKEKPKWGEGEIEKVEIEIVKEREIVLPAAIRNFEKVPPRPAEPIKPEITYDFKSLNFKIADYNPSIRPLRLQQEPLAKLYSNYVSAGYGNYQSPLLEAYMTNKRSKDKFYGVKFSYQNFGKGPVDDENSASSNTELSLFGKAFGKYGFVSGFLNYEGFSNHFYGYEKSSTADVMVDQQKYNIVSLGAEVESKDVSDFNFVLRGGFSYLDDRFKASESEVVLSFRSDYDFSDEKKFILNSDYFLISRKDELVEAKPRHIFKVKPAYRFMLIDNLSFTAGVNVVLENDTLGKSKPFHLYPDVKAAYDLGKSVELYAALTGDIDKVSLHSLARENPWLQANIGIFNSNRTLELLGGIKGKLGSKVAFGSGFSVANIKDWYFFYNNPTDRTRFITVFDKGNTQRTNFFGDLSFSHASSVRLSLRGDWFGYSTDDEKEAWHRPTYRVSVRTSFNIVKKILLSTDLISQGGAKAFDETSQKVVTLDPALDLNVRLNYFVSKQFSVFVRGSNLLSTDYQLYYHYPVRRLQVLGGITYVF